MNKIITIGREFGSGGRELGRRLSEELGIAYYDQEIVTEIARRTSLSEQYVHQVVEHRLQLSYPIHISRSFYPAVDPLSDQTNAIFQEQTNILREMEPLRIFVYADMPSKIARCRAKAPEHEQLSDRELKRKIQAVDKHRASYYDFYTGQRWGAPVNYDLCVNTTRTSIKDLVLMLVKLFR